MNEIPIIFLKTLSMNNAANNPMIISIPDVNNDAN
jgi:hypothetical protein